MTNEQDARLYELLCAYVLGEGSEAERAEVECALQGSADLRAERARLEDTIGLVKGTLSSAETLSAGATAQILSKAAKPRHAPWHAQPWMRLAAGITVLALGYAAVRAIQARSKPAERLAQLPADQKGPFLYSIFGDEKSEAKRKDDRLAALDKNARANGAVNGPQAQAESAAKLGSYRGPGDTVGPDTVAALDAIDRQYEESHVTFSRESGGAASSPPAPSESIAQALGEPSPFGGQGIGPGVKKDSELASEPIVPAASGPAGPGGGAAAAPAVAKSEEPPFRAAGEKLQGLAYLGTDATQKQNDQLRALGYVGDSDEGDSSARADHANDFFIGRSEASDDGDYPRMRQVRLRPEDRERYINDECVRILRSCYRRPNERPRDMYFRFWGDNPFELTALDPQSTFSVDVDTASYTLARRYINEGNIPQKAQVRTEEFVNYFKADVPAPLESTFAIHTDLAPSRFSADAQRLMLRVVVRGREVSKLERKPLALTFVIDVSGSMREQNRLEMVKHTLRLLLGELDANDRIAIVAFSTGARLVVPMMSASNRAEIETALFSLKPEGSTNSEAGLRLGYDEALSGLNPNATNRVVFLSDGVANVGVTDAATISSQVQRIREKGIYLNTIGVGMNNHNDVLLEQLADKGDGVCNYIDTADEARRVMVDNFTGAFEPIARDVKIQVEFDPAQVSRYRLLGYENRAIADKDFRNDAVDAGEVGAGHQVVALYELERANHATEKPLATVRLRWKAPRVAGRANSEEATEVAQDVLASQATSFEGAGPGYRRAVIVAQFAEILRRSQHARGESIDDLIAEAMKLERESNDADFTELVLLVQKSKAMILRDMPRCDDMCQAIEALRRNEMLRAELYDAQRDTEELRNLERLNAELEQRIRELLRKKLEESAR